MKSTLRARGRSIALLTILFGALSFGLGVWNITLQNRNVELQTRNQQLQSLLYNYTPNMFAYPKYEVTINLDQSMPNGELDLIVVVVTPHNGYGFVNQTFFQLNEESELLDPQFLKYNDVDMYREVVFAVPQGSSQLTLKILFWCTVYVAPQYLGGTFSLGLIGLRVTFYNVQAKTYYFEDITVNVRVNFHR